MHSVSLSEAAKRESWHAQTFQLHGGFAKLGVPFGGPYNQDYNILGSILVPLFRETTT